MSVLIPDEFCLRERGWVCEQGEGRWDYCAKVRKREYPSMRDYVIFNKLHDGRFRTSKAYASNLIGPRRIPHPPIKGHKKRASPDVYKHVCG